MRRHVHLDPPHRPRSEPRMSRVVVVTGASAGVGRAVVRAFARRGWDVALIARGRDGLEAAAREVRAEGRRALVLPLDVADADEVEHAAERVESTLGPIDIWVNDAMVSVFARFMDITAEEFRRVTEVTYLGYVHGTQAALRRMLPRDRGTIVQLGSALAYRSIPLQSAYCGAKHAIHGLCESIRTELRHDGSRVHIAEVQLPAVNTPQFTWSRAKLPRRPQPVPPSFSRRSSRTPWCTQPSIAAVRSGSAGRPFRRSCRTRLRLGSGTGTWRPPASRLSRRANRSSPTASTPSMSRCQATLAPTVSLTTARRASASPGGYPSIARRSSRPAF